MDEQKKPRARAKKVVSGGKGVEIHGEGLGTGPVNNMGNYEDRKAQQAGSGSHPAGAQRPSGGFGQNARPGQGSSSQSRPSVSNPFGGNASRPSQGTSRPGGNPFGKAQQPQGSSQPGGFPFGSTQQGQGSSRPAQNPFGGSAQRPAQSASRPAGASASRPSTVSGSSGQRQRASGGGGGSKIMLIVIVAVLAIFGSRFLGGNGGNQDSSLLTGVTNSVNQAVNQGSQDSGSGVLDSLTQVLNTGTQGTGSSGSGLANLLSSFLSSGASSAYDFSGGNLLSSITGNASSASQYFTSSMDDNTGAPDMTVASGARDKYTRVLGGKKDTVTLMVYLCGTDLESQNGMATADIKEMLAADLGDRVNLLIYTGGCRRWKNNVFSSQYNQIYLISGGKLQRLEDNMGNEPMTNPATLQKFIQYGAKNYPANRMMLILWDHGGGSVSGYGYDEKIGRGQSMSLAGINTALKGGGVKFDFVGFDACLMATVENGIMLSQYADYMIGSEETEPGVGWYYTNWLTKLGKNPGMPTVEIGKNIADDFVEVCAKQCRGQATTLSIVDLAELESTVPGELKSFSIDTNEMIQNKEYKAVSTARSKTREFAQSSRIDQIDLVHFARNMGTAEGKKLASALEGAVKYNRTGGGISNAYGLSIYFPYKKTGNISKAVSTYAAIGMDEEYTRCIQEFASLELSGQVATGTGISSLGLPQGFSGQGLMDSLLGGGGYSASPVSAGSLTDMLGGLFGGGGSSSGLSGSMLDLFMGRSMTAEKAADYISANCFDPSQLSWKDGRIEIAPDQWELVTSLTRNVFYDNGSGFIDLGNDNDFMLDGNALQGEFDGTWISIDRQPVAYYYLDTIEEGDHYLISGYVPALLNGTRVNLLLYFDDENPYGYIAGAQPVYSNGETDLEAKTMISIGAGDRLQFICDFFDYEGNYRDSYQLGREITLGSEVEIANTEVGTLDNCRVTYCFTDLYQQRYWTPAL